MAERIYSGITEAKVDAKCRIAIPSMHRELLGESFRILLGLEHCLIVIDNEGFEETSRSIMKMPYVTSAKMARRWNAYSFELKADKQGRIVIPPQLRNQLSIEPGDELVVAGSGCDIEIWHKGEWDAAFEIASEEEYMRCAEAFRRGNGENGNENG